MNTRLDGGSAVRAGDHSLYQFIPYVAFVLVAAVEVLGIARLAGGGITYTLDDAYIHLALAERIGEGTYGINAGEFAAPASSILWPFMLSFFSGLKLMVMVPCVLNLAAALGTLTLMARTTRRALETDPRATSELGLAALITLLIPATNLLPLAFTGMEHSLQQLLAVVVVTGLIEESRSKRAPLYLWACIVLLPVVRYDSLALSVPALIYLTARGHLRDSIIATVLLASGLGAFSWFLKSHGVGYLPTSVLAKSDVLRTSGAVSSLFVGLYVNLVLSPQGNFLLLESVVLAATAFNRKRASQDRGLAAVVAAAVLLHLTFGRVGAYFRYEAYLSAAAILMLIHLHRDWLRAAFLAASGNGTRFAVLGSLAALSTGYGFALVSTPLAAGNVYSQQYQLHRFAVDYFKGPVAVNDLGWVSFRNPYYVLDFWGLGSAEAQHARLTDASGLWMERLCREHGVGLIMIYDDWFPNRPRDWIRLGSLQLLGPKITPSGSAVQFYARDSVSAARARLALAGFTRTLPPGAAFIP